MSAVTSCPGLPSPPLTSCFSTAPLAGLITWKQEQQHMPFSRHHK
jgi:hypothetical protein